MQTINLRAGQISQPVALDAGSVVSFQPVSTNISSSGYVEYTFATAPQINNNLATWVTWPKGVSTAAISDIVGCTMYARAVCTLGQMTYAFGDPNGNVATQLLPWISTYAPSPFDSSGNYLGSGPSGIIAGLGANALLWSQRPSATSYPGAAFRFTDVGGNAAGVGGGSYFFSNGTRYKAVNGEAILDSVDTANVGTATATEQQLNPNHIIIPAGVIGGNDRLDVTCGLSKSGATDTMIVRIRFGSAGTTADAILATINVAAASLSVGFALKFKRISATTIQLQGSANTLQSYGSESASAYASAVTVPNLDSVAQYLSVTAQMSGTTDTPTLQDYTLKLNSTDSA